MAKQTINIGSSANDGTGDPLRTAFNKINANFTELYGNTDEANDIVEDTTPQLGGNLDVNNKSITTNVTNGNVAVAANGTGTIELQSNTNVTGNLTASGNIIANGNINLGNAAGDQVKVTGVFEADQLQIDGTVLTSTVTNGPVSIQGNGTGNVNIENVSINQNEITASNSNDDLVLSGAGTGSVKAGALKFKGTSISSDDSTIVNINEGLVVSGAVTMASTLAVGTNATVSGNLAVTGTSALTGAVTIDSNINITDNVIKTTASNSDLVLTPAGTGGIVASGIRFKGTSISADDSSIININEGLTVDGNASVSGTLTTADVTTTGNVTISGNIAPGTLGIGDLNITADGTITTDSNGDINLEPAGTGAVKVASNLDVTGTGTVTGQFNVDNLRLDGNVLSATSGSITLTPATGMNVVLGGIATAAEFQATLGEFVTLRTDTLSTDTSNANLTIGTQGTGHIVLETEKIARTGNLEFDMSGYVVIDSGAGDIYLKDDGTGFGILSNSSGNLEIKSGNTTALSMTGANVAAQGDLSVAGSSTLDGVTINDNTVSTNASNADLQLGANGTGVIDILTATQTTVGSAGGANALPGQPTGYIKIKIGGTLRVIPFYDQA
tara:strand:- start:4902 stop:6746 length:1845 start_codon:yes stop_codon:yes gene_type:complete